MMVWAFYLAQVKASRGEWAVLQLMLESITQPRLNKARTPMPLYHKMTFVLLCNLYIPPPQPVNDL